MTSPLQLISVSEGGERLSVKPKQANQLQLFINRERQRERERERERER